MRRYAFEVSPIHIHFTTFLQRSSQVTSFITSALNAQKEFVKASPRTLFKTVLRYRFVAYSSYGSYEHDFRVSRRRGLYTSPSQHTLNCAEVLDNVTNYPRLT